VMSTHLQFCIQVSMHSNNGIFLIRFVGKMHFAIQIQIKLVTP
jgi:hypothetical protein